MHKGTQDWVILPLSSVISKIVSGVSVNAEDRQKESGELGVLKMSCITDGVFNPTEHKAVLSKEVARVKCNVKSNTIIMGRKNTPYLVGTSAFCPSDIDDIYLSDLLWQIHVSSKSVNPKWFSYLLASPKIRKEIAATASGTSKSMKGITKEGVLSLTFLCPPLLEQHAIVEILDTADESVRKAEALVEAKVAYKRALAVELLTEKRRFAGSSKSDWVEVVIGDVLAEVERPVEWDDDAYYDLISVRRRSEGLFSRGAKQGIEILTKNLKTVKTADFIISKMQVVHGAWGIVPPEFNESHVSGSYVILVAKNKSLMGTDFFNYLSQLPIMYGLALKCSHGVHIEKMTFKLEDFLKRKIRIPSLAEQRQIVDCLSLVDEEIGLLRRQCAALKLQKQGLMQKLLTGEVRVPGFGEVSDGA